ncbi:MAG TPA: hypothetical protein GXX67_12770 [Petrimonas sp.]|nr:hypothetical protein [Petrimonas sp.]
MSNKRRLFVDFDLTLVDSIKAYADTYNIMFKDHPDFTPADPKMITEYDFSCICPLLTNKEDKKAMWNNPVFFDVLQFIDNDTLPVLKRLHEKYELIICTIGTPSNLALKALWLKDNLPFIDNYILINNGNCEMSKSIVNMRGAIQIDDIPSNLEGNSEIKILFGKEYPWNRGWYGERCLNWKSVEKRLLFAEKDRME